MNPVKRRQIYQRLRTANPEPRSELHWRTPFELLVAVMLSAQATDRSVNLATARLFPVANTPRTILALGREGLEPYLRTIGLYRSKTKHVIETCRSLLERHGGEVPRDRQALESLPGVGRKTANVVLNVCFGEPTMAVDTHIFRLANRIRIAPGRTPLEVERKLVRFTPPEFMRHAHHWLILHGRYICKARRPECDRCLINDLCEYPGRTAGKPAARTPGAERPGKVTPARVMRGARQRAR